MTNVVEYLDERLILFLDVETRDQAIQALIDAAYAAGKLPSKENFYKAILAREQVVSTGIGMGVALPHAKIPDLNTFLIAVGVLKKGLDWNALDGAPVRIIFMIGGPDDKQTEYLQVLSGLTHVIKNEDRRKKLIAAEMPRTVMKLFQE